MNARSALTLAVLGSGVALAGSSRLPAQYATDARLINEGQNLFVRVWTVEEGLGPTFNARSCVGCHSSPELGGSGTDERAFVVIAPTVVDPSGGHVFRRLRAEATGAVTAQMPPANGVIRKAPALFGSGHLETVPEAEIRRPVPGGRFGWKGRFAGIDDAVEAAFVNELGLGTPRYPERSAASAGHPGIEISQEQIRAVSAFVRALSPLPVGQLSQETEQGRRIFYRIGCSNCHRPSFPTLERRGLSPYTDLLLHDIGPALADGINEGAAKSRDFKTPPLWGVARTGPPYLHDGRARTLREAIAGHGGEAERTVDAWRKLSSIDQTLVIRFLQSL